MHSILTLKLQENRGELIYLVLSHQTTLVKIKTFIKWNHSK